MNGVFEMLVNIKMRGNDQVAFAPREIKRAVPVGEFGIQVQAIPEFTGNGIRVFSREQTALHFITVNGVLEE